MTIEAYMADGRVLEFPDGTSSTVIESTVKRLIAEKAAQQAIDTDATLMGKRNMKTYEIKAPDGRIYLVEGPEGATDQEVLKVVLASRPEAGIPPKEIGMSFESVALLITSGVIAFGIAFFVERKFNKTLETKAQKIWLSIAATMFGLGLMGLLNEFIVIPNSGLTINFQKIFGYLFFNIVVFPVFIGLIIWWLKTKSNPSATELAKTLPTTGLSGPKSELFEPDLQSAEDLYAKALNELEGGKRINGVWAKCFADADGVENVAKAQYIKIGVSQLQLAINQARQSGS